MVDAMARAREAVASLTASLRPGPPPREATAVALDSGCTIHAVGIGCAGPLVSLDGAGGGGGFALAPGA